MCGCVAYIVYITDVYAPLGVANNSFASIFLMFLLHSDLSEMFMIHSNRLPLSG